jgi:hypothetical protein
MTFIKFATRFWHIPINKNEPTIEKINEKKNKIL